jgi:NAD(P)H-hydrate epimerase
MIRLTRAQVREVDRLAIEKYLIPGIVLMENASRCAADVACEMLGDPSGAVC